MPALLCGQNPGPGVTMTVPGKYTCLSNKRSLNSSFLVVIVARRSRNTKKDHLITDNVMG